MKYKKYIFNGIWIAILGIILHFVYDLSGNNPIVGIFSPMNESTWEHLKLLFYPMVIYSCIQIFMKKVPAEDAFFNHVIGIIAGMFAIVASFYTYTGILGKNIFILDFLTYLLGIFVAFYIIDKLSKSLDNDYDSNKIGIVLFIALFLVFVLFSFYAPRLNLFVDPTMARTMTTTTTTITRSLFIFL